MDMEELTGEQGKRLQFLASFTRNASAQIDKTPRLFSTLSSFRKTSRFIYVEIEKLAQSCPRLATDLHAIPSVPESGSVMDIPGEVGAMRIWLDSQESSLILSKSDTEVDEAFLIKPGQPFTANRALSYIFESSTNNVKVVDNYLSTDSLEIIEKVNSERDIKIITTDKGTHFEEFKAAALKTKAKRRGSFEVKISGHFHDRYVIVDNISLWHCGPSLDQLGSQKVGIISHISDSEIVKVLNDSFDDEWKKSIEIL